MEYKLEEFKFNAEILRKILISNILLYCVIFVLVLKIFSVGISINFPNNIFFADITRITLEKLANETRQAMGLNSLKENQTLNKAAQMKAEDMVKNQYFSHTSPTGLSPWYWFSKAGYTYKYAGENLAIGFFESRDVFNAWLNSPSHKENLLNPNYKEIGTAVLPGFGGNNTIVVVQLFGASVPEKVVANQKTINQKPVKVEPDKTEKTAISVTEPIPEKVLSQMSVAEITTIKDNVSGSLRARFMNYVIYNNTLITQEIALGMTSIVIGLLISLIFFSYNTRFDRQLIIRALTLIILLSGSLLFDKEVIMLIAKTNVSVN